MNEQQGITMKRTGCRKLKLTVIGIVKRKKSSKRRRKRKLWNGKRRYPEEHINQKVIFSLWEGRYNGDLDMQ